MPQTILSVAGASAVRSSRNEVLRAAGFEILEADTGAGALRLALECRPTLIVLAVELPDSDGFSICQRLKSDPRTASVPVLHISKAESTGDYLKSLESGADWHLQEPVESPLLVAGATALIRRQSGRAATNEADRDAFARDTLAALIESIPDEVWFADAQGMFVLANPSALREFKMGASDQVRVEDLARSLEVFRADGTPRPVEEAPSLRALAGETVRGLEEIIKTPVLGELRYRQVSASPVKDATGSIVGSVSVVRDTTEQKRAEQELRASEERYRVLFETRTEGFGLCEIICDDAGRPRDYRYLAVNPAFERHTGHKAEEALRRTVLEAYPETEPSWIERFGKVALTGEPTRFEGWFESTGRWFDVSAFQTEPGRFGVVFTDLTERKRAEAQASRSQRTLSELVERAPFGIYIVDSQFRIAHMNAGSQGGAFRNVRPVIGRDFTEAMRILWPEPVAAGIIAAFRHTLETGEPYYAPTFFNPRHDVEVVEGYEWELHRMTLPDGQYGVVCYYFDSTKLRAAEAALRESEEKYRELFESIDQGFCTIEVLFDENEKPVDYRFLMINPAFERQTGIPNATGRRMRDIAPLHEEHWFQLYGRIALTGEAMRFENPATQLQRYYDVLAWRIGAPAERRVAILFNDISDRRRAEEAQRESESRERARSAELEALMEMTPAAIFVAHDPECRHMSGNRRAYDLLRWGHGKNISKSAPDGPTSFRAMKDGIEIPPTDLPLQKAAATGQLVRDYAFDAVFEDGVTLNLLCDAAPLLDEQGRPRGGVGVLSDVTELKRTEAHLRQSQKLESLGLLAGGVAHDFNNLLVGVVGNASLAQEMLPPDHPVSDLVAGVLKAGEQAAHLTRQMLAYSGKGKFVVEPLNLSALIPEMIGLVRPSTPKKIALHLDLQEDLPAVEADRGQIQQVFMNLALNAGDAIGSHEGAITVRTGVEEVSERYTQLHSETTTLRPGKYVFLEVRDTGCGMDEATKTKIFDPFFSTKFVGRGLGLAAVTGIVRGHKGAITVTSAPGQGSCFTVLFPAAAHAAEATRAAAGDKSLTGVGTVLVVDDEAVVRAMAKRALERQGYTVLTADGGFTAIDLFRRHPGEIAAVVLDLSMPRMNGEEALPELRKIRPEVKVIVSSGYSESEAMVLFQGQRVSGFIQKPYTSKGIAEKLKACLA